MNSFIRALMFIYSVVIAVISVVLLYALVDDGIFADILSPLSTIVTGPVSKYIYLGILMLLFVTSIISITNIITSGRLNRTRLRKNDIGTVDIGPDAIESIALNAAKSALHRAGQVILEGHIRHCVRDGIEHGDPDQTIANFTKAVERFANMN